MEALVEKFIDHYGEECYLNIKSFLEENSLTEELQNKVENRGSLFEFAVHYGIYDLVTYLYEIEKIPFRLNITPAYYYGKEEKASGDTPGVYEYDGKKLQLNRIIATDKYIAGRNRCMDYLLSRRKYSKMIYRNRGFYYIYNR